MMTTASENPDPAPPRVTASERWFAASEGSWLRRAYAFNALLALTAIWLHRYPVGVDLPGHAQMFDMLVHYGDPRTSFRFYYYIDFFTPYALVYLVAWPLTKLGGPLFAVKAILSIAALTTPLALARWLRAVGSEVWMSLFGFVLAFGFPYLWGFISMTFATPIAIFYLASVSELLKAPSSRRVGLSALLAVLLFFSHGITFGVTMLAGGISCLLQRNLRRIVISLLHFLPVIAVMIPWYLVHRGEGGGYTADWPDEQRFLRLLSATFSASVDYKAALAGFVLVLLVVAAGKPVLSLQPVRVLPLFIALLGLFALPEWLLDTWLVGGRFGHFVHIFAPGAFDFRRDRRGLPWFRGLIVVLVALSLVAFHLRLRVFNREMAGLDRIKRHVPAGSDVKLFAEQNRSEAFGPGELGQVAAWIPAAQGGFLENDLGRYFQNPIQRRRYLPWPTEFRFLVARGTTQQARAVVGYSKELVEHTGDFNLFENHLTRLQAPGMNLRRWAQDWHEPRQDHAVEGNPLNVAGKTYATGLGTHARSILEMELASGVQRVRGMVGMDDEAPERGMARFAIMDNARRTLWSSREHGKGDPPESFDVPVAGLEGNLFLVVDPVTTNPNTHADWLEVRADH